MHNERQMTYSENHFIGQIPADWPTVFAKDVLHKVVRPVRPDDGVVTCFRDGQVILRSIRRPDGFTVALKEHGYQGVRIGDLVIHAMDAFAGAIGVSESDGKGSPVLSVCSLSSTGDSKYYSYLFRALAYSGYIESVGKGIRERSTDFRFSEVAKTIVPLPPIPEQQLIADHLDHHTSLIDRERNLIAKKISLLKDKRKALIFECVTGKRTIVETQALAGDGGERLDDVVFAGQWAAVPTPTMDDVFTKSGRLVDSGVEWIGDIPEGWSVKPAKSFILAIDSGVSVNSENSPAENNDIAVMKTSCVSRGWFDPSQNKKVVSEDIARVSCNVEKGTLIVSRMNTPSLVGAAGLVSRTANNLFLPDRLWRVRLDPDVITPEFAHFWTLTHLYRDQVEEACSGTSASMQNVPQHKFQQFKATLPPLKQQQEICNFITYATGGMDLEISLLERKSELLSDKRKALIFEAVTGKIDLRDTANT